MNDNSQVAAAVALFDVYALAGGLPLLFVRHQGTRTSFVRK